MKSKSGLVFCWTFAAQCCTTWLHAWHSKTQKLQALAYDILPPTAAIIGTPLVSCKKLFVGRHIAASL